MGADLDVGDWRLGLYGGFAREKQDQTQTGVLNPTALQAALADTDPATAFNPFGDGSHTNPATLASLVAALPLPVGLATGDGGPDSRRADSEAPWRSSQAGRRRGPARAALLFRHTAPRSPLPNSAFA